MAGHSSAPQTMRTTFMRRRSRWSSAASPILTDRISPRACARAACFSRSRAALSMETAMTADTNHRHYLMAGFDHRELRVALIGCGGNGAQMLMGLASLDTALRAISSRSLHVTVVDDDIVTEANLG